MEIIKLDYSELIWREVLEISKQLDANEYKLLYGHDMAAFQQLVQDYLVDGWRCQGGISVTSVAENGLTANTYYQAIGNGGMK